MKAFIGAAALISLAGTATAQSAGEWDFTVQAYLWGSGMSGTTSGGRDIDIGFSDVLDALDFGFMGSVIAERDSLFTFGDLIYLKLSEGKNAVVGPGLGPGIPAVADAQVKGTILTAGVGYDMAVTEGARLAPFAGVRMFRLDSEVNIGIGPASTRVSAEDTYWDGIVGFSGHTPLSPDWGLTYYVDVGAGQSDLTWQAAATFDRHFEKWTLSFGYRHMAWELPGASPIADISFSGPIIGARFQF